MSCTRCISRFFPCQRWARPPTTPRPLCIPLRPPPTLRMRAPAIHLASSATASVPHARLYPAPGNSLGLFNTVVAPLCARPLLISPRLPQQLGTRAHALGPLVIPSNTPPPLGTQAPAARQSFTSPRPTPPVCTCAPTLCPLFIQPPPPPLNTRSGSSEFGSI